MRTAPDPPIRDAATVVLVRRTPAGPQVLMGQRGADCEPFQDVVLSGAVISAVMPEWRERAAQVEPAPGSQFLDALQVLRVLWEAHRAGDVVTVQRLHAVVKQPIDRIESVHDTMSVPHWTGRTGRGWMLARDAAEIRVVDVYRLFVFGAGAKLPSRQSGQELDRLALALVGDIESRLELSVEALFVEAAGSATAPRRMQAVQA